MKAKDRRPLEILRLLNVATEELSSAPNSALLQGVRNHLIRVTAEQLEEALTTHPLPTAEQLEAAPQALLDRYEERLDMELADLEEGEPEDHAKRRAWGSVSIWWKTPRWAWRTYSEHHGRAGQQWFALVCEGLVIAYAAQFGDVAQLAVWDWARDRWRVVSVAYRQVDDLERWAQVMAKNNRRLRPSMGVAA